MRNAQRGKGNSPQPDGGAVHLQIERLVLEGFPLNAAQAARLQATVEQELGRMLTSTRAESWTSGATRQLPATPLHLAPGNSPAVWGRQIARTLFASLSPQSQAPLPTQTSTRP